MISDVARKFPPVSLRLQEKPEDRLKLEKLAREIANYDMSTIKDDDLLPVVQMKVVHHSALGASIYYLNKLFDFEDPTAENYVDDYLIAEEIFCSAYEQAMKQEIKMRFPHLAKFLSPAKKPYKRSL